MIAEMRVECMVDVELFDLTRFKIGLHFVLGVIQLHLKNVIESLSRKDVFCLCKNLFSVAKSYRVTLKPFVGKIANPVSAMIL